jgi:glutamate-ammonia-ligase adenylyltransferase
MVGGSMRAGTLESISLTPCGILSHEVLDVMSEISVGAHSMVALAAIAEPWFAAVQARVTAAREAHPDAWTKVLGHASITKSLARVFACSEFVATACLRDSELLPSLLATGRLEDRATPEWMAEDLRSFTRANMSENEVAQLLRRFRRRHMVRIAWRDLAGWADVEEVLSDLSALADLCVDFACTQAAELLVPVYGTPRAEDGGVLPLVILAMGKLGGRELNFSSDIDLVFLYPHDGETEGPRPVAHSQYFLRLGQKVIQLLDVFTADGFVYRVDMRLRPFGESGPLSVSFGALEDYLQQHGRDWERYAYVKARPMTGKQYYAKLYEHVLRPFVYRRYLDFGVFESLRSMKSMVAKEVARRELQDSIKLGPGGIREIEFIAQAFQLLRGGQDRRLQQPDLLVTLSRLAGHRLLSAEAVQELTVAYRFLRRVENRLQAWNDEQTHELPAEPDARERLALAMGYADWAALDAELTRHRLRVAHHFAVTVFGPVAAPPTSGKLDGLLELRSDDACKEALALAGITEIDAVFTRTAELRDGSYYRQLDETGRRRLNELLPRVLPLVAREAAQAITFSRVARILERIGGRTVYLALLNESPHALARLVKLAAGSQFLADQVAAHPLLLDELMDARLFEELPDRSQFIAELDVMLAATEPDPERQIERLKQLQSASIFKIAVADLTGRLPLMKVSDRLTDLAEIIVAQALTWAWEQVVERYGRPFCGPDTATLRPAQVVVVAYGKLGGIELGYGSDLDLVFLHDSAGEVQQTDAATPIDNGVFFAKLGQRLIHELTVQTRAGVLYDVDLRLRPSGKGGLLVQSLAAFEEYQRQTAWTWEHQALLRARSVAGAPSLREAFEQVRVRCLREAVRRDTLREEVRKMRERMRAELSKAKAGQFDLKQDPGGIADLEFLTQYWMLALCDRYPEIIIFSDNIRQLESLASGDLVPQDLVDFLTDTYRRYRERLHHLSLEGGKSIIAADEFVAERARVCQVWDETMGAHETMVTPSQ